MCRWCWVGYLNTDAGLPCLEVGFHEKSILSARLLVLVKRYMLLHHSLTIFRGLEKHRNVPINPHLGVNDTEMVVQTPMHACLEKGYHEKKYPVHKVISFSKVLSSYTSITDLDFCLRKTSFPFFPLLLLLLSTQEQILCVGQRASPCWVGRWAHWMWSGSLWDVRHSNTGCSHLSQSTPKSCSTPSHSHRSEGPWP